MLKQVTKDSNIVKIATESELNFNFIKSSYSKILKNSIENEKIFKKLIMDLIPVFNKKVCQREIILGKDRTQFTVFEEQQLLREFEKEHADKLKVLQGGQNEKIFKF